MTYMLFLYEDIQWSSESTVIGFNAGENTNFFSLIDAHSEIQDLKRLSNVGIDGVYAFRVDSAPQLGIIASIACYTFKEQVYKLHVKYVMTN